MTSALMMSMNMCDEPILAGAKQSPHAFFHMR